MIDSSIELKQALIDTRDISGVSAEYLMTFLKYFTNEKEKYLIYALCCNLYQVEHGLNIQLNQLGVDIATYTYNPKAFKNVSYLDVDFVSAIKEFLLEKEEKRAQNIMFRSI